MDDQIQEPGKIPEVERPSGCHYITTPTKITHQLVSS